MTTEERLDKLENQVTALNAKMWLVTIALGAVIGLFYFSQKK